MRMSVAYSVRAWKHRALAIITARNLRKALRAGVGWQGNPPHALTTVSTHAVAGARAEL